MPKHPQKAKNSDHLKRLRAIQALKGKLVGKTTEKIAEEMGVSTQTIDRAMTYGERAGVFIKLEDELLQKVAPAALKAILSACEDGDAQVAMDALDRIMMFQMKLNKQAQGSGKSYSVDSGDNLMARAHQIRMQIEEEERTLNGSIEGTISEPKQLTSGDRGNAASAETVVSEGQSGHAASGEGSSDQTSETIAGEGDYESTLAGLYTKTTIESVK